MITGDASRHQKVYDAIIIVAIIGGSWRHVATADSNVRYFSWLALQKIWLSQLACGGERNFGYLLGCPGGVRALPRGAGYPELTLHGGAGRAWGAKYPPWRGRRPLCCRR